MNKDKKRKLTNVMEAETTKYSKNKTYKIRKEFPNGIFIHRWNLSKEFATAIKKCKTYKEYLKIEKGV